LVYFESENTLKFRLLACFHFATDWMDAVFRVATFKQTKRRPFFVFHDGNRPKGGSFSYFLAETN